MRRLLRSLSLAAVLLAAGCADSDPRCASLPGGGRYCLQATTGIEAFDVQQSVAILFEGRRETMIAQLEADADGVRFVGLTPFGQKLVQLSFDNREVKADTVSATRFDPALLLAIVQIAMWPIERVRDGLDDSMTISESESEREIARDGKRIVIVKYTRDRPPLGDLSIGFPEAALEFAITKLDLVDIK
jgi:hypothetical protein